MKVVIDNNSGFCFGVVYAITMAEDELNDTGELYCLGDIVHNDIEVKRLQQKGLRIINHEDLNQLKDCKVLIRAHGEPPQTYITAMQNNIELLDASCPVVLKLQNRVKNAYDRDHDSIMTQIVRRNKVFWVASQVHKKPQSGHRGGPTLRRLTNWIPPFCLCTPIHLYLLCSYLGIQSQI